MYIPYIIKNNNIYDCDSIQHNILKYIQKCIYIYYKKQ